MKPTPGSPFRPDRRLTSELIDLAQHRVQQVSPRPKRPKGHRLRDYKQALVRNDHTSETTIPQYGIVEVASTAGITASISNPILLSGTEPTGSKFTIAIAQEPIAFGVAKKCTVSGVSVCQVDFPEGNREYQYANKIEGDITKLQAGDNPSNVEILNPRSQAEAGTYWVLVRLVPSQSFSLSTFDDLIINSLDCCRIPCADPSELTENPSWDSTASDWPESWRFSFASPTNPFWAFANGSWTLGWNSVDEIWETDLFDGPCGNTGGDTTWRWTLSPLDDPNDLGPGLMGLILTPTTNFTDCIAGEDVVGLGMVNRYEFVPACANYMVLRDSSAASYYSQGGAACSLCLIPASDVLSNRVVTMPACLCGDDPVGTIDVPYYFTIDETMSEDEAIAGCCDFHELFIGNKITFQLNTTGVGCPSCQVCWSMGGDSLKHPDASCSGSSGLNLLLKPGPNLCGTDFLGFSLGGTEDGYDNIGINGSVFLRCTGGDYYLHLGINIFGFDFKGVGGCNPALPLAPPRTCTASYVSGPLTRAEVEAIGSVSLDITSNVWEDPACACAYCTLPSTITLLGI